MATRKRNTSRLAPAAEAPKAITKAMADIDSAVIDRTTYIIGHVMRELRALREVAHDAIQEDSPEKLALLTIAICERAHRKLDCCNIALGESEAGNYSEESLFPASEMEASHG